MTETIKMSETSSPERAMQGISLVIAPLLFASSTFFWKNGEYDENSATLLILSLFFWIPALTALFGYVKNQMPYYSVYGLWIAVYGCVSGICFAFLGYITTVLNVTHEQYLKALSHYPVTSQLLLFSAGPLFPLSLLVVGINLIRVKSLPLWPCILLCLAAIAFPLSRIPRIVFVAHVADLLMIVPCIYLGTLHRKKKPAR